MTKKEETQSVKYGFIGSNLKREAELKKYYLIFTPNKRFLPAFGAIILAVLGIAALRFPFGNFMSGNIGATIGIGYPLIFFEFELSGQGSGLFIGNLIIDLIIYTIFAYVINVLANFVANLKIFKNARRPEERPSVFKDRPGEATADKLAKKVGDIIEEKQIKEEKENEEKMFAESKKEQQEKIEQSKEKQAQQVNQQPQAKKI